MRFWREQRIWIARRGRFAPPAERWRWCHREKYTRIENSDARFDACSWNSKQLQIAVEQFLEKSIPGLNFRTTLINDARTLASFLRLHRSLEKRSTRLGRDHALMVFLHRLLARHSTACITLSARRQRRFGGAADEAIFGRPFCRPGHASRTCPAYRIKPLSFESIVLPQDWDAAPCLPVADAHRASKDSVCEGDRPSLE